MSTKALPEPRHACANCANFYPIGRIRVTSARCYVESKFDPISGKDEPQFEDAVTIRKKHPDTCPRFSPKGPSKASQTLTQVRGFMGRVGARIKAAKASDLQEE